MILEKISKPLIQLIINEKINKNQFGFRPKSDCGLAKAMIYYKAKQHKYNKALLIDIKKAYDTVDLEILKHIINEEYENPNKKQLLINFIKIYQGLILIINGDKINTTRGLPQGSAPSPIFFNLYINRVLEKLSRIKEIHIQAYADDIIILGNNLEYVQKAYDEIKQEIKKLSLEINPEKCELISEEEKDVIKDKGANEETIIITAKKHAKYLGQIINEEGIPTKDTKNISFGYIASVIKRDGSLTKIAKIRIFQTYMRSKINHLIPMIVLSGGVNELWKTIRRFIFVHLLEFSTLPRESASAFKLGFYEIIIRPVKKLIERNYSFTNNKEENEMLNECLIIAFKNWLVQEPKHTDKIRNVILNNIEKKTNTSVEEFDKLLSEEYSERLFRNHEINKEIVKKLKIVKSPSLITIISNEPEHEIRARLVKYNNTTDTEKKDDIRNKIIEKILKIKIAIEYLKNHNDNNDNDINKNNINLNELIIDYTIKEIKIKKEWTELKEQWIENIKDFVNKLISINNNKSEENIITSDIYILITKLRERIGSTKKEKVNELEIAIEIEEQNDVIKKYKAKINDKNNENQNKKLGRPPKKNQTLNNQIKITDFFNNKI